MAALKIGLAALVAVFYWAYSRLWFYIHIRRPELLNEKQQVICAHFHGDELLLIGAFCHSRMAILASWSRDGEFIKRVLQWFGYRVVRGSSSRGGVGGLKGLIDAVMKDGLNASLAVDGPKGPLYQVKPGILKLAQETGKPLLPGAAAANRRISFKKAWNRCYLPLPFARCVIVYGELLVVPPKISDRQFEMLRLKLENELTLLKQEAEQYFAKEPTPIFVPGRSAGA